jgi:hypothetical protein
MFMGSTRLFAHHVVASLNYTSVVRLFEFIKNHWFQFYKIDSRLENCWLWFFEKKPRIGQWQVLVITSKALKNQPFS